MRKRIIENGLTVAALLVIMVGVLFAAQVALVI
jgi:hypothetical protein